MIPALALQLPPELLRPAHEPDVLRAFCEGGAEQPGVSVRRSARVAHIKLFEAQGINPLGRKPPEGCAAGSSKPDDPLHLHPRISLSAKRGVSEPACSVCFRFE